MSKQFICINCPLGCHLEVDDSDLNDIKVSGNTCPRGKIYAISEVTAPKRMVTDSVPVDGGDVLRVSVKTAAPIPKEKIFDCIAVIRTVRPCISATCFTPTCAAQAWILLQLATPRQFDLR